MYHLVVAVSAPWAAASGRLAEVASGPVVAEAVAVSAAERCPEGRLELEAVVVV
jgi:hypothetical protein